MLTTAVSNMQAAYTDANSRATGVLNAGSGNLAGLTLVPGVYTFNGPGNVTITSNVTLSGSATDVWIFQIPGTLSLSSATSIILSGGALASNVFWAVAGSTTLGTTSVFEGNILAGPGASTIALQNGATLHGRALGQTDVTLIGNTVVNPSVSDIAAAGVTELVAPVRGATPVTAESLEADETTYEVTSLSWSPTDNPFDEETAYTATIVLTSAAGFKFPTSGIAVPTTDGGGTVGAGVTAGGNVSGNTLTFTESFRKQEAHRAAAGEEAAGNRRIALLRRRPC